MYLFFLPKLCMYISSVFCIIFFFFFYLIVIRPLDESHKSYISQQHLFEEIKPIYTIKIFCMMLCVIFMTITLIFLTNSHYCTFSGGFVILILNYH